MLDHIKEYFRYENGSLIRIKNSGGEKVGSVAGWVTVCNGRHYRKMSIKSKSVYVHQAIFILHHGKLPKYIDHIDGNSLNNKIENLRTASQSQNMANSRKKNTNTSGYKGVTFRKDTKKWQSAIMVNGKHISLGSYEDKEDAAIAYEAGALKYYQEFAKTDCTVDKAFR